METQISHRMNGSTSPLVELLITEDEARRIIPHYERFAKRRRCLKIKSEIQEEIRHTVNFLRRLRLRLEVVRLEAASVGLKLAAKGSRKPYKRRQSLA